MDDRIRSTDVGWPMDGGSYLPAAALRRSECTGGRGFLLFDSPGEVRCRAVCRPVEGCGGGGQRVKGGQQTRRACGLWGPHGRFQRRWGIATADDACC